VTPGGAAAAPGHHESDDLLVPAIHTGMHWRGHVNGGGTLPVRGAPPLIVIGKGPRPPGGGAAEEVEEVHDEGS
jgi:hypothetical protein